MVSQTHRKISTWLDSLLRGRDSEGNLVRPPGTRALVSIALVCGCSYGAVMGAFSLRPLQMFYSAAKMPLLFALTVMISLPAFYVLNTLAGLRDDFMLIMRALAATQAGVNIILLSFAPLTAFWYCSSADYSMAVAFNALAFGLSSLAGQLLLMRFYRPLIRRNPRHKTMLVVWLVIFSFVGIQSGWMLRPFIGSPGNPTVFVRTEEWSNAYVAVYRLFARVLLEGS